jgi:hypothetical protein
MRMRMMDDADVLLELEDLAVECVARIAHVLGGELGIVD